MQVRFGSGILGSGIFTYDPSVLLKVRVPKINKIIFFDEMRLKKLLRLYWSLRPLRYLMPGKSLSTYVKTVFLIFRGQRGC